MYYKNFCSKRVVLRFDSDSVILSYGDIEYVLVWHHNMSNCKFFSTLLNLALLLFIYNAEILRGVGRN